MNRKSFNKSILYEFFISFKAGKNALLFHYLFRRPLEINQILNLKRFLVKAYAFFRRVFLSLSVF